MSHQSSEASTHIIRASEIGQWTYCQRAWWLARQGYDNRNQAALQAGIADHARHGHSVASAQRTRSLAFILMILGVLALMVSLLAAFQSP